jgi:hypothetical protein
VHLLPAGGYNDKLNYVIRFSGSVKTFTFFLSGVPPKHRDLLLSVKTRLFWDLMKFSGKHLSAGHIREQNVSADMAKTFALRRKRT